MKNSIYFFLINVSFFQCNVFAENNSLQKKYPDLVLSDDYGILSEKDIIFAVKEGRGSALWQCFPTKDTKFSYNSWLEIDDPNATSVEVNRLCDFNIKVKAKAFNHFYFDRRARYVYTCRLLQKGWKELTKNQSYVCLNGSSGILNGKEKSWFWNKAKTKNGCMSLFSGHCGDKTIQ